MIAGKKHIKCQRCGELVEKKSNSHKYCKKCAYIVKSMQTMACVYRKRYYKITNLGSSGLSSHFCGDFDDESMLISKEIRKIKLKKQFS